MNLVKKIKYINFAKLINLIRLNFFYAAKRRGMNKLKLPFPYFVSVEPTNYCNLKCPACPSGAGLLSREKGYMDMGIFKRFIDKHKKYLINIILHFQGEPLLHNNLGEMINYARTNKIHTMFSTNGQLLLKNVESLIQSKPDKIILSLDGLTQETYNKYRINGDINKIYEFLEYYSNLNASQRPNIELQFLVFSHNIHEIPLLKDLKKQYKINKIVLKTAQIYNTDQLHLLPEDEKYLRYKIEGNNYRLDSEFPNKCKRIIFGSVITWNGNVVPCCFDKNADYIFGNINNNNLCEIRNSENYNKFINSVFSNRKKIDICKNCTEGLKNE